MSVDHWFGTDAAGKDLFSQVLVGARVSLFVAVASALIAGVVGIALGVTSAITPRCRRRVDRLLHRRPHRPPDPRPRARPRRPVQGLARHRVAGDRRQLRRRAGAHPARRGGERAGPGLHPRRPRVGHVDVAHGASTRDPQHRPDRHRPGLPDRRPGDPRRGRAVVPRRDVAVAAVVGPDARRAAAARHRCIPAPIVFPALFLVAATLGFNLLGDGLRDATDPRLRS